jgi:hypothetical protein
LGIGDWGLGPIPNPQSPIPNPQSPISEMKLKQYLIKKIFLKEKIFILIYYIKFCNRNY